MTNKHIRLLAGVVLALALVPVTWLRTAANQPAPSFIVQKIAIDDLPPEIADDLGPFLLVEAWELETDTHRNHSYSALSITQNGTMFLASDKGDLLRMPTPTKAGTQSGASLISLNNGDPDRPDWHRDIEAMALDEEGDRLWLSVENFQSILRLDLHLNPTGWLRPPAMRHWTDTYGGEAMVRLDDGRFLIISEGRTLGAHMGLLFPDDPVSGSEPVPFRLEMPGDYRPTEMVLLPDGSALVLGRDFDLPFKFETMIAHLDLQTALEEGGGMAHMIAKISNRSLADNYEGMAIVPTGNHSTSGDDHAEGGDKAGGDEAITIWIVSDNNKMQFMQRTALLKLELNLADLEGAIEGAQ